MRTAMRAVQHRTPYEEIARLERITRQLINASYIFIANRSELDRLQPEEMVLLDRYRRHRHIAEKLVADWRAALSN
jgi:hypothetical protein